MHAIKRIALLNLAKNAIQNRVSAGCPIPRLNNVALQQSANYAYKIPRQKLLRFPAFPLDETLDKFMRSVTPLLNEKELEETKKEVEAFRSSAGKTLQQHLEKAAAKEDNWLADRWLKVAYLQYRDPVTVYVSPGMTFPFQTFKCDKEFLSYASKIIFGMVKFKKAIDNNEIPIVKMGKNELDNSQFYRVYGTCRIPKPNQDTIEYNPESKHVVVIYKNHFYKLPVFDNECQPLHADVLNKELEKIYKSETTKGVPFGILSTDNRDNWAKAYDQLINPVDNEMSVKQIRKALFTVSLDESVPVKSGEEWDKASAQLIHGGGSEENSGNRWMDKTIQLILNPNGISGFCYEHSPAEGQPIALIVDYVVKNIADEEFLECGSKKHHDGATKLPLRTNMCMDKCIEKAKKNLDTLSKRLQIKILHFEDYGKGFCKKQKLSPDSYVQIALQYAFYKLHKVPAAQYESAHLRIYYNGRTETIRSCSVESLAFAKGMMDPDCGNSRRICLLRKAIKSHREYTVMALQGRGVDRHLLGLKLMAIENGLPVPKLYSTPGWLKGLHYRMSTSQVASPNAVFMSFGPAVADGYACCYNPRECDMILAITAWQDNKETSASRFANALTEALRSMHELLNDSCEQTPSKL